MTSNTLETSGTAVTEFWEIGVQVMDLHQFFNGCFRESRPVIYLIMVQTVFFNKPHFSISHLWQLFASLFLPLVIYFLKNGCRKKKFYLSFQLVLNLKFTSFWGYHFEPTTFFKFSLLSSHHCDALLLRCSWYLAVRVFKEIIALWGAVTPGSLSSIAS